MRLKKIKLAGFKSFVDPTNLPLPSNRMAIVGPNGCGKSNIIDAVRWVMGESSAKHLRGDSMADVIFNGSTSRKPVGQCSVELVFDNSEGSLGGQYAAYNEIAIKRQVGRDGQSHYFLNGIRCRRRDITDIFLGTGLGPRSYAIIEQGTISRLIEAKPEELRVFLEEAAGISKYKERRRETENRIQHTVENLNRLNDLREEIERQLGTLKRQAKNAEKYQELKQAERQNKAQMQALRWQALDAEASSQRQAVEHQETSLEAQIAELRQVETRLEKQREAIHHAREQADRVQEAYYQQGAEIARLEQQLHHQREQWVQHQQEQEQVEQRLVKVQQLQEEKRAFIDQIQQALTQQANEQAEAQHQWQKAQLLLEAAEKSMQDWQVAWEEFNQQAAEPTQTAEVERIQQQQLERQQQQLQQRLDRLEGEAQQLMVEDGAAQLQVLRKKLAVLEQRTAKQQENLTACSVQISDYRAQERRVARELHEQQGHFHHLCGRLTSLQALQQAALGQGQRGASAWLEQQGLAECTRLAEQLRVKPGWESAVECVLGPHLEAVCVAGLVPSLVEELQGLEEGDLVLLDTMVEFLSQSIDKKVIPLLSQVEAPWPLEALLAGIYTVETIKEAWTLRAELAPAESVITRDGIWLSRNWVRVARRRDEKSGMLARGREIEAVKEQNALCQRQVEALQGNLEGIQAHLQLLEEAQGRQQKDFQEQQGVLRKCQATLAHEEGQQKQHRLRHQQIRVELEELQMQLLENEQEQLRAQQRLQIALAAVEELGDRRAHLRIERDRLQAAVEQTRSAAVMARDTLHRLEMHGQALQTNLAAAQEALALGHQEAISLGQRQAALQAILKEGESPLQALQFQLEAQLQRRMTLERQLNAAREKLASQEEALRVQEQEKQRIEKALGEQRTALERLRVEGQAVWIRAQTLREQLSEEGFHSEEILRQLPPQTELADLEAENERLSQCIQRLGLINLAAIDEYRIQAERKQYLDSQDADLVEALQTLENAIRRIDRETRSRFRDTFDKVNAGLQALFPKLFGGGKAYLELDDDDLLNTGVKIMARPPGKRNTTIYLLSGGEKALTAVALVFAIFQLNPAPFCMLDEVDAPLDDTNVGRFCELVKEMSAKVQFILVTHNKMTMEVGHQLTGVTMHEPGVSRLVAVDVDEAVQLAAV